MTTATAELAVPAPVLERHSRLHWAIWLIPLLALVAVGFYGRTYFANRGPLITIALETADGLRPGNTALMYRGVAIGEVAAVNLSEDNKKALIDVRLRAEQEDFARQGASFWIVRPEVSAAGLQGLNTLLSGPYIEGQPGTGERVTEFVGLAKPPSAYGPGLNLLVHAPRIDHLQEGAPVFYRGVQVGAVRDVRLGRQADRLEAKVTIWERYAPLVRAGSRFWALSGFNVKGGIFSGIEMNIESIKTIMSGGLAFATPDREMGGRVRDGAGFALADAPEDDWLKWAPRIPIQPARANREQEPVPPKAGGPKPEPEPMKAN